MTNRSSAGAEVLFFVQPSAFRRHCVRFMAAAKKFTFICGSDDFLVGRLGKERFEALAAEVTDEFSRETINGFAANVSEVEGAINRFRLKVFCANQKSRRAWHHSSFQETH